MTNKTKQCKTCDSLILSRHIYCEKCRPIQITYPKMTDKQLLKSVPVKELGKIKANTIYRSFIYQFYYRTTGKCYIGKASSGNRLRNYMAQINGKKVGHYIKPLFKDLHKNNWDIENLFFKILEFCADEELLSKEDYYIKNTKMQLYNQLYRLESIPQITTLFFIVKSMTHCNNYIDCWLYKNIAKYAHIIYDGKNYLGHRITYQYYNPDENISHKTIRHICNNPRCCNPYHLQSGTDSENALDKIKNGNQGLQKTSFEQTKQMYCLYKNGYSKNKLSKLFNIHTKTVTERIKQIEHYLKLGKLTIEELEYKVG